MYEPAFLMNIHKMFPSLETLVMITDLDDPFPMNIIHLVESLDSIGSIKNLCIKGYGFQSDVFQYILNNKEFRGPRGLVLNEDQTKVIFERAKEVINKKFPINSTEFEIVDSEYGWSIKKGKGNPPTMTKLPYKCTIKQEGEGTCTKFFAEKAKFEEHVKWGRSGHFYPNRMIL